MKLYMSAMTCSLAPHIIAREAGLPLELVKVDRQKKTSAGEDYLAINPKGYVPALGLDDGQVLTEGPAIAQYLADLAPDAKLAPPNGTMERYRLQEMLAYINSEIHKTFTPLFYPDTTPAARAEAETKLHKRYALLDARLAASSYLFGEHFTVADAYLFTVTNWAGMVKLDLSAFPHLTAFQARVGERPSVKEAVRAEKTA